MAFLKLSMDLDSTTPSGRSFHSGITHGANSYFNTSVLGGSLVNFLRVTSDHV